MKWIFQRSFRSGGKFMVQKRRWVMKQDCELLFFFIKRVLQVFRSESKTRAVSSPQRHCYSLTLPLQIYFRLPLNWLVRVLLSTRLLFGTCMGWPPSLWTRLVSASSPARVTATQKNSPRANLVKGACLNQLVTMHYQSLLGCCLSSGAHLSFIWNQYSVLSMKKENSNKTSHHFLLWSLPPQPWSLKYEYTQTNVRFPDKEKKIKWK